MGKFMPRIKRVLLKRKESGSPISQTQMAEMFDVKKQQVLSWVNGHSYPRTPTLFQFALILGCKVEDLYERVDADA
ncbi:helix-turn-helix transcriptional regulator [Marininema halotolerans]|uniref:DNA-binding transcriptional regulator, XRE-family HTH domain n=1 Tax=Marininema halotolerans TaxID=1155944 RepID=A0A1I6TM82_9BACL|nr:helix-turn-helix transcriptional regulator [Marininema halotolerans]SFS90296.1 DNA-binding transcriptional regulator, XRE-family HTH domain [Marininema halotolerans]